MFPYSSQKYPLTSLFMCTILFPKLGYQIVAAGTYSPSPHVCASGTYRSNGFFNGDCVGCPEHWKDCASQPAEDVDSCEKACGKPSLVSPTPTIVYSSTSSYRTRPGIEASAPRFQGNFSPTARTSYPPSIASVTVQEIQSKTTFSSPELSDERTSNKQKLWMYILIGASVSLTVIIVLFVLYLRVRRRNKLERTVHSGTGTVPVEPHLGRLYSSTHLEDRFETRSSRSSAMDLTETYL